MLAADATIPARLETAWSSFRSHQRCAVGMWQSARIGCKDLSPPPISAGQAARSLPAPILLGFEA